MSREQLIQNAIKTITKLDEDSLQKVNDLLMEMEEKTFGHSVEILSAQSGSFNFLLEDDDELYQIENLKVKFK
jgi:hypothetical protein